MLTAELESFYACVTAEITSNVAKLDNIANRATDFQEVDSLVDSVEKKSEEAKDLLEQIELSLHSESGDDKEKNRNKLQSYKTELERLLKDFRRVHRNVIGARERVGLVGSQDSDIDEDEFGPGSTFKFKSNNVQEQLLDDTETIERSGRKLNRGRQLLENARSTGAAVLKDLSVQREVISRARRRLAETDDDMGTGSRLLSSMLFRAASHKVALYAVFGAVILVIAIVIYAAVKS